MLFCSNCGKQVTQNAKFCSNCGNEIINKSVNKIDNTIDSILSKTNSIKEEVNQSYYYNQAKEKTKTSLYLIKERIIIALGYLSIFFLSIQFVNFYFFKNELHILSAYERHFYSGYRFVEYFYFLAEILPSTILPMIFVFLLGLRKNFVIWFFPFFIILFIASTLNDNSINYNNDVPKTDINYEYENNKEDTINASIYNSYSNTEYSSENDIDLNSNEEEENSESVNSQNSTDNFNYKNFDYRVSREDYNHIISNIDFKSYKQIISWQKVSKNYVDFNQRDRGVINVYGYNNEAAKFYGIIKLNERGSGFGKIYNEFGDELRLKLKTLYDGTIIASDIDNEVYLLFKI